VAVRYAKKMADNECHEGGNGCDVNMFADVLKIKDSEWYGGGNHGSLKETMQRASKE
jgi:hypothetical protein